MLYLIGRLVHILVFKSLDVITNRGDFEDITELDQLPRVYQLAYRLSGVQR